ncbi:queuosine precursor transporter [Legionella bozemanae]|nr:queuosine precursor transporter [Legionella bozemanae]
MYLCEDALLKKEDLYYKLLSLFHMGSILIGMALTSRIVSLTLPNISHTLYITGGIFFIPIVFFIQDIVTEIFGYDNARVMLNTNILVFIIYVLILVVLLVSINNINNSYENFYSVVNTLPRHALSFVLSLYVGGRINNYVLSKMKLHFNQKFLAFRFISSTAIGEAFFQFIAVFISWYGSFTSQDMFLIAFISYTYKILFEILATPFNIWICNYLKSLKLERVQNVL